MPPSNAIVNAGRMSFCVVGQSICGMTGMGSEVGIAPKRLPMVSTGIWKKYTAAVVSMMAMSEPGTLWVMRGQNCIMAMVETVKTTEYRLMVVICAA